MKRPRSFVVYLSIMALAITCATPLATSALTPVQPPKNPYPPSEDVKLGRKAAAEAERKFPIMHNQEVQEYIEELGQRLVAAIPSEYQHPEFQFSYKVVNVNDLNAFALPG